MVDRHQGVIQRVAAGMVGDRDLARDLAQEAMLQAYLSLDRLRDADRFGSWLYGIVLNVCRSYLRDQKASFLSLEAMFGGLSYAALPFAGPDPGPEEVAEAGELHRAVLESVNSLPPKSRAATLLFYYEQLSHREIAALLNVSIVAVKGRLHKARIQLRDRLRAVFEEPNVLPGTNTGGKGMVKVTIADVVASEQKIGDTGHSRTMYVVMLLDQQGCRVLPIWVGAAEGPAIAMGLRDFQVPRPLTHKFMVDLLGALGADMVEARVESLKEDTFYGVVKLRLAGTEREVDARPSDALALAVYTGSPIYVADEVLEKAGITIPEGQATNEPVGKGLDAIVRDFVESHQRSVERWKKESAEREKSPTSKREHDERLIALLYEDKE